MRNENEEEWFINKLMGQDTGAGYLVQTKSGKTGRTRHSDSIVNGKQPVYLDDGGKMLCSPEKLKIIGYVD